MSHEAMSWSSGMWPASAAAAIPLARHAPQPRPRTRIRTAAGARRKGLLGARLPQAARSAEEATAKPRAGSAGAGSLGKGASPDIHGGKPSPGGMGGGGSSPPQGRTPSSGGGTPGCIAGPGPASKPPPSSRNQEGTASSSCGFCSGSSSFKGLPHRPQNLNESGFGALQFGQRIVSHSR